MKNVQWKVENYKKQSEMVVIYVKMSKRNKVTYKYKEEKSVSK